jgi:YD repeat-containing protein
MKYTVTLMLILCLSFLSTRLVSQELPTVIPPTPEAASLFKFIEYPIDYATGIPQISIPLYEIKSGKLTLPITINYHSAGRKVYDETGAIGLGWTLMAGGMISRTVYGEADDNDHVIKFPSPWKKQADINTAVRDGADFLDGVFETWYPIPWYDTEYDIFSYSVNSISGKFVLRDVDNVKVPVLIPKKSHKIEYSKATMQYNINYFEHIAITDDKGTLYQFGKSLKDEVSYYETSGTSAKNSWLLTEIISPDKADTIYFKYQSFSKNKRTITQQSVIIDMQEDCYARTIGHQPSKSDDGLGTTNDSYYTLQRLVEIRFKNGKAKFNLEPASDLIKSIQVQNLKGEIIKKYEFTQSTQDVLSDGNPPTRKLDKLTIKDGNTMAAETYTFAYYPTAYPLGHSSVNGRFRDLWGYYNVSGNQLMRPSIPLTIIRQPFFGNEDIDAGDPGSTRTPNLDGTRSGVLKKITFPTGGSREFFYEQNRYMWLSTIKDCGGLRLAQTITSDGSGVDIIKTYKYGIAESGYGTLPLIPNVNNMSYETMHQDYIVSAVTTPHTFHRRRIYSADVLPMFSEFHQKPVVYKQVTEYHGTLTDNIGKTIYTYDDGNQFAYANSVQNLFSNTDPKLWKTSSLKEKVDYKKNGAFYDPVKKVGYDYTETIYGDEKVWGLHVGKYYFITPEYWRNAVTGQYIPSYFLGGISTGCAPTTYEVFRFSDYTLSVGKKELTKTTETMYYDGGKSFETIVDYSYNSHHLVSRITTNGSGNVLIKEQKYPSDFLSEAVYSTMVGRNMLDYPIEEINYRNGSPTISTKTSYRDWGVTSINTYILKPEFVSTRQGSAAYETRLTFHSYDNVGNLLSVSKDGGGRVSYQYAHQLELPVAQVSNAAAGQIFYEGFEDANGNSGEYDSKAGRKSRIGGYTRLLSNVPNGIYNLTYFQKTAGAWTLVPVSNITVTNETYNINLPGQVDEIRFYPQGSTMTTYTYNPLEGITSITDENNFTTYYEYDTFQRVLNIKDLDKNAIKQFNYHYKE